MQVTIYKNCGYYWSVIPYSEDVDRELSRERYSLGNNYSDLSSKLTQVIEQIPKDVLYDFLRRLGGCLRELG